MWSTHKLSFLSFYFYYFFESCYWWLCVVCCSTRNSVNFMSPLHRLHSFQLFKMRKRKRKKRWSERSREEKPPATQSLFSKDTHQITHIICVIFITGRSHLSCHVAFVMQKIGTLYAYVIRLIILMLPYPLLTYHPAKQ